MPTSGNNQGSSASDPIDLLSSSAENQTTSYSTPLNPGGNEEVTRRGARVHQLPARYAKRPSESPDDDNDSDVSYRRTRRFRAGGSDRSASSSGQGSTSSAGQVVGTPSNPIVVGEPSSRAALSRQDLEPRPPRSSYYSDNIGVDTSSEARRRHSNYIPGNPAAIHHHQTPARDIPTQRAPPPRSAPTNPRMASLPAVPLPRWQPDAEVTYCPICHTQFSFFIRKHHCRKCGRVVCDACSPHRITIPYQYIVQQPGAPRISRGEYPASLIAGQGGYADFSGLGGGERVRLCNPCVPDPNIAPPQAQTQDSVPTSSGHSRSQSTANQPPSQTPLYSRLSAYMGAHSQTLEQAARSRSVTMSNQSAQARGQISTYGPRRPIPPSRAPASDRPFQGLTAGTSPVLPSGSVPTHTNRALPPVPQPQPVRRQIAEEDECPVCHHELPSRHLPNFEAAREAHITACIMSHSSTPTRGGGVPAPSGTPSSSSLPRRTGMFPYKATEKDCVDSAECTICLEEFEVGVDMARLECLCRFHRRCINAWFERHPGQCPMHQHDGMGF